MSDRRTLAETFESSSSGVWHTAAIVLVPPLLNGGFVYTWGSGRVGQLGLGQLQVTSTPTLVTDLLEQHVVVKNIYTGMYHNAALSVDDEVYTWGSNVDGCLGRPEELLGLEEHFCVVPGKVEGMKHLVGTICSVACK